MFDTKAKQIVLFLSAAFFALASSQLSSYIVVNQLAIGETYPLNSLIHFTHIRNYGGIFGSFSGKAWVFTIFSLILLTAVSVYVVRSKELLTFEHFFLGLIVGGGSANITDRYIYGSVVDFINVQHIPYWNYIFNTADTFIHLGVWPLLFLSFYLNKEKEDNKK